MEPYEEASFEAAYDAKDVIVYALSVGYGMKHDDDELRFVFEQHAAFTVAPTLALTFLFRSGGGGNIPMFPPPMMQAMGVIPPRYLLQNDISLDDYPLLHVHQHITWTQSLPVPTGQEKVKVSTQGRLRSIVPKDIGVFVTQELTVRRPRASVLCTLESTFLVLGLEPEAVQRYGSPVAKRPWQKGPKLLLEVLHPVEDNAALLYRMASGDSNRIHVDRPPIGDRPILHGLCSMGIVSRYLQRLAERPLQSLECRFAKPVFIGDCLKIEVWCGSVGDDVVFLVRNVSRNDSIALSNGRASFQSRARL